MTKTYYIVKMTYCCELLGMSKSFARYSDAREFALMAKENPDNTYISIEEITVKGLLKKHYESKVLDTYNEL